MFDVNDTLFISVPAEEDQENPWLRGAWRPQGKEYAVSGDELTIIGSIPEELDGIYVRNTHNNATTPTGIYHPFDGDGMLHAIRFRDGTCEYRNAFVRTTGFLAEQGAKAGNSPASGVPTSRLGIDGVDEGQCRYRRHRPRRSSDCHDVARK